MSNLWTIAPETVAELHRRLLLATHAPPPPDPPALTVLLTEALAASLTREEGRPTTFALTIVSGDAPELTIALQPPLPFSCDQIRRLAPILGGAFDFLVIGQKDGDLVLRGMIHVQQFPEKSYRNLVPGLFVVSAGPGQLSVGVRGRELLRVSPGNVWWLPQLVGADLQVYRSIDRALGLSTGDHLCSLEAVKLLDIARAMLRHGHGGALMVVSGDTANVKVKYEIASNRRSVLRDGVAASRPLEEGLSNERLEEHEWMLRDFAKRSPDELVQVIAQLSAVDGAVLLDANLDVRGFGTFVSIGDAESAQVTELRHGGDSLEKIGEPGPASRVGGARHQSAVRFVHDHRGRSVAFVASQDGALTLFIGCEDGTVVMIRPIGPAALARM